MNIKVATTDRFRKAFRSFGLKDQKQIDNKINLFIEEPTNPSNNYETLHFIDEKLKSIRVSDDVRIILAIFDGIYFLLHVDRHDAAYDWGKNKRIDRSLVTGAVQIYTDPVEINESSSAVNPLDESADPLFGRYTDDQLKAIGVPEGWIEKIKTVSSDEKFMELWSYLPNETIDNLNAVKDGFDIRNLIIQIQNESKKKPAAIEDLIKIQPGLHIVTEDSSLEEVMKQDINVFRYYLHPSQKELASKKFNGPMKVTGGAGTGKTVVALHRTKHLVENLRKSDKPVFFTTYTTYLIRNIQSLFESEHFTREQLIVSNIHKFAVEFAKEIKLITGDVTIVTQSSEKQELWRSYKNTYPEISLDAEFLQNEYEKVIQKFHILSLEDYLVVEREGLGTKLLKNERITAWNALANYESFIRSINKMPFDDLIFMLIKYITVQPELKPFSHIVCDEIQDLTNLELRFLRILVPEGINDLFLTGDPFQNIYQRQIKFKLSGINITGNRSRKLKINYRTTEEIRQFAIRAISGYQFDDFTGLEESFEGTTSLVYGEKPEYLVFPSEDAQFKYILKYIRESFGVLGLHEICFAARLEEDLSVLKKLLDSNNFPNILLREVENLDENKGKVVLSTLHGLKGLEFKNLIIFNLSDDTFPCKPRSFNKMSDQGKKEFIKSEHALLYVAFSRAINKLTVIGVGKKIGFIE